MALLAERRARGCDGQRMRFAASSSVDLASMLALRSQVIEAAGARSGVEQPGQTIAEKRPTSFLRCATTVRTRTSR